MNASTNGRHGRDDGIVIAGGGLAGQRCAECLRREGYSGPIRIVCSEARRPYDRPPLSKDLLSGARNEDALSYRPADWYGEHTIDLLLGIRATGLRPQERRLVLSDGGVLRYDRLLIATGSRPRAIRLLTGYDNVSTLRTLDDALLLREVLATTPRLAIIGAGFIGLEIASTARSLGVGVTLIEAAACPLQSVLGCELGSWFERLHCAEGVEVLTGRTVGGVDGNGNVHALRLSDQSIVEVDHIVVGVGVEPDISWLAGSGLDQSGGIPVDPHGRTSIDRVFASGDAAATLDERRGRYIAGSHWEAAGRQGARAARVMLGLKPGEVPLTSFWSDQYGLRIQYVGDRRLADSVEIDGDLNSRNFTATFTTAGRAVAALLVGRPRSLPAARLAIEKGTP
jgi:3-phenylpropionate/trans-cinnamate dioxygenase ferredoxin reductase subunit